MTFREKGLLAGLVVLICLAGSYLLFGKYLPQPVPRQVVSVTHRRFPHTLRRAVPPPFSGDQIKTFLAQVREAEEQSDPLRRCLAYPNPPGSHWTHDAVAAYCRYRFQPTITFAEAKDLIEQGKSAELDRRMDEALQAQLTQPDARGRLDHIFISDFENGSFSIRPILDAWKRASPKSAYAYAASGYAYVEMAHAARGGAFAQDTPQDKLDSMERLLKEADTDLERAIALNPHITPVYAAMIHAGGLSLGKAYADHAVDLGLRADPSNWYIYHQLMWLARPEWFGSLGAMQRVATSAMTHASQNPLLVMEKMAVQRYEANPSGCNCAPQPQAARFPAAFDELAISSSLADAGSTASSQNVFTVSVVYLSEALRFQPQEDGLRRQRAKDLAILGESQMARDEANKLVAADPKNAANYEARGNVYMFMSDYNHAEQDFEAALASSPDDIDVLVQLGGIYVNETHEWDKGWDITDRLIKAYPNYAGGWVMRATIQMNQPRAGLDDTYEQFVAHFGTDPAQQPTLDWLRRTLAQESSGNKPRIGKSDH